MVKLWTFSPFAKDKTGISTFTIFNQSTGGPRSVPKARGTNKQKNTQFGKEEKKPFFICRQHCIDSPTQLQELVGWILQGQNIKDNYISIG